MKVYSKKTAGAVALFASAALVLAGCSGSAETEDKSETAAPESSAETVDTLKIASLLPQTGSLGFLMPPVQAGIAQALVDINEAGGVLGNDVEIVASGNEGDSTDTTVLDKGVNDVLASDAAFVLGAMSSSMTLRAVDKVTADGMMMGSPSNTAAALDGYDPFYFRTAPADTVQGAALANQIINDGVTDVAILVFNDDYGIGLRDTIQETLEAAGASVVYGGNGQGQEFPVDQKAFAAEVTAAMSSGAEAIVVLTFDQIKQIVPELAAQQFDLSNLYLVDGNTNGFEEDFEAGLMEGAQGTIPGAQANDEFTAQLEAIYKEEEGQDLVSLTYAPEAYDLVMLVALAAERAGSADSASIQANLQAVSGANGGTECTSFSECVEMVQAGDDIQYRGKSGIGPLNEGNDPSSAFIGIYKYDADNNPEYQKVGS